MKKLVPPTLCAWCAALIFMLATPIAQSFSIDTSNTSTSPMTGVWDNSTAESGWGAAVIQQYGTMFVTMYVYDGNGNPVWYVASACAVSGNGCTGTLYKVTGGSAPTVAWNGANKVVASVGTLTLAFSDVNTGTMTYTIDGASGSKAIKRNVFASPTPLATPQVAAACTSDSFTTAKYDAIKLGMTFNQVTEIMGCAMSPDKTQHQGSFTIYTWWWSNNALPLQTKYIYVWFDSTGTIVTDAYSGQAPTTYFKVSQGF